MGTVEYEELTPLIYEAVSNAMGSVAEFANDGHTIADTEPGPILVLHFDPNQAQLFRREVGRRVVDNLVCLGLVAERDGVDDVASHLATGGYVIVRRSVTTNRDE